MSAKVWKSKASKKAGGGERGGVQEKEHGGRGGVEEK